MAGALEGRVALVTGGGRGIGREISLALAGSGADVAVNYRKDEQSAHKTVEDVRAMGCRAHAYAASVESFDQDQAMVASASKDLGPIDLLVSNAGIASRGASVADTDPAELERVVRIHAFGAHYLSKLVLPEMRQRPRGDIVMISSDATRLLAGYGAPYNMAKAALEALAVTLAREERPKGIRVNVVAPGLVETEMGRRLVKGAMGVDDIHQLDATSPFGHVCRPQDVAEVVLFLVSSSYVSGQVVYVNGASN